MNFFPMFISHMSHTLVMHCHHSMQTRVMNVKSFSSLSYACHLFQFIYACSKAIVIFIDLVLLNSKDYLL